MLLKWKVNIELLKEYRFGTDGNLYRLPYVCEAGRHRSARLIKLQYGSRWKIGNKWITKNQLTALKKRGKIIEDKNPIEIKTNTEEPSWLND
jgi:hypothetical protein